MFILAILTINIGSDDYSVLSNQALTLEIGETCVNISIEQDSLLEDDETFMIYLTSNDGRISVLPDMMFTVITIVDDDSKSIAN